MFYHYSQNNSGGSFDFDKKRGITHHVVIEADSASDANQRAESIGLYFNGCEDGRDCPCCGDRWYNTYGKGDTVPMVYGRALGGVQEEDANGWMERGYETVVHFKDGTVKWYDRTGSFTEYLIGEIMSKPLKISALQI